MEEIRTEAGVSAGLMYRYFASKDDMIEAAISGSMAQFEALVAHLGTNDDSATANGYLRSLLSLLQQFRHHSEGVDLFRLAVAGLGARSVAPRPQECPDRQLLASDGVV